MTSLASDANSTSDPTFQHHTPSSEEIINDTIRTTVEALGSDSESDLTDLSDIDMNEEENIPVKQENPPLPIIKTSRTKKRKPSITSSSESEPESEYETKPSKKKTKKRASMRESRNPKSSSSKGKLKTNKGKGKQVKDPDSEEEDQKPKKKVILAKEVKWNDLPNWGKRTDCPLLELPEDILDLCFGLNTDLGARDYIALSGVSKFFRNRFTPDIFHSICWSKGVKRVSRWYSHGEIIEKPEVKSLANHIFSRATCDRRSAPPNRVYEYGTPTHYIPQGCREEWSEPQYIVYKEEQAKWRSSVRDAQVKTLEDALKKAQEEDKKQGGWAIVGGKSRRVLGTVAGRENGQPPVKKDTNGLPVKKDPEQPQEHVEKNTPNNHLVNRLPQKKQLNKSKTRKWTVPDTDGEEEYEISPDELVIENKIPTHDYWPNKWRDLAASWVNHKRINKSDAMTIYKVTEAELLCLKHLLVTNPMSAKIPQQAYVEAAVEALAWRAHGGVQGHKDYINARLIKSRRISANREAKIEKAKEEGTYVYKHKKRKFFPNDWHWRDVYCKHGPNGDCASDCEACEEEDTCHCGCCSG